MDILILNWKDVKNPTKGGAEVIAFEFAKRLVKEGHSVTFFSRSFAGAQPEEIIDGVKIVRRGNPITVYIYAYFYYKNLSKKPDKVVDMVNTICWQTPLYVPKGNRVMYVNQLAQEVFFYELPFP
ncbi:MAG TPA: glycosyltransferase, partial [Patescibacteria group bacterium]